MDKSTHAKSKFTSIYFPLLVYVFIDEFRVNIGGLDSKEQKNALNEIRILASLEHPQIISYKEAFYEESTKSLWIIMEFAEGGDLQQLIDTKNVIKTANHLYGNKKFMFNYSSLIDHLYFKF